MGENAVPESYRCVVFNTANKIQTHFQKILRLILYFCFVTPKNVFKNFYCFPYLFTFTLIWFFYSYLVYKYYRVCLWISPLRMWWRLQIYTPGRLKVRCIVIESLITIRAAFHSSWFRCWWTVLMLNYKRICPISLNVRNFSRTMMLTRLIIRFRDSNMKISSSAKFILQKGGAPVHVVGQRDIQSVALFTAYAFFAVIWPKHWKLCFFFLATDWVCSVFGRIFRYNRFEENELQNRKQRKICGWGFVLLVYDAELLGNQFQTIRRNIVASSLMAEVSSNKRKSSNTVAKSKNSQVAAQITFLTKITRVTK